MVAQELQSTSPGILSGLLDRVAATSPNAMTENEAAHEVCLWELLIPGAMCGLIPGYATLRHQPVAEGT